MAAAPGFEQLSRSAKAALRFAWAAALARGAASVSVDGEPSVDVGAEAEVDSFDLLIGILLAHPTDSEARKTFSHFDLVAGQALPSDYPNLTAEQLNRYLAELATETPPPTSLEAEEIIRTAVQLGQPASKDGYAELRSLWVALLQTSNRASSAIRDLLTRVGVNADELVSSSVGWLGSAPDTDYDSVLEHFSATPIDIVNYKADRSRRTEAAADPTQVDDFVGVTAEVDAFAYLLASRNLEPPLAVGLFGDWGSGKSYFLDAIKRRIDQLVQSDGVRDRAQVDTQFWKHIVQVEFNAWHYIEGDLWSSLVDHIFNQLNLASEKVSDNIVARRQRYLLGQLTTTAATMQKLEEQHGELERKLGDAEQDIRDLRQKRDEALAALEQQRARRVLDQAMQAAGAEVLSALAAVQLGSPEHPQTLGEAGSAIATERAQLEQSWSLVRPFLKKPGWLVLLLVCLFAAPLIAYGIEQVGHSGAAATLGGLATLLTVFGGAAAAASRWVNKRLDLLAAAQLQVDAEIAKEAATWQTQVDSAQRTLDAADAHLAQAESERAMLNDQLDSIKRDLEKKPEEVLNEFLRERLQAGDYRKRLGVPAIIRRDFRDLADLISYQNAYLLAQSETSKRDIRTRSGNKVLDEDNGEESPLILNRIILYIDDLDRCPDGKVIEVLQAVHMLLAFPLFVVVVAVDARWLAHALQTRYPALAGAALANGSRPARPDDYLEKIFQIPFWVADLNEASRGAIVQGLLGPHVAGPAGRTSDAPTDSTVPIGKEEMDVLAAMISQRAQPPRLGVTALRVTPEELEFLHGLTPLMGHTPRSIKRFVNLYQLMKILRRGGGSLPVAVPRDEYVAAFLLALAEGSPAVATALFGELKTGISSTLGELLQSPALLAFGTERVALDHWMAMHAEWQTLDAHRTADLARVVKRFLFRVDEAADPSDGFRSQLVHVIRER